MPMIFPATTAFYAGLLALLYLGLSGWVMASRVSNNVLFDNAEGGIVVGQGDGPNNGSVAADHFVVSNNIAVDNGKEGIKESGTTGSHNRFLNNILWLVIVPATVVAIGVVGWAITLVALRRYRARVAYWV